MRIPSQFNDESLYRGPGGRSAVTYRRIFRLALGLALIVVVMDAASEESIYSPFFGDNSPDLSAPSRRGSDETRSIGQSLFGASPRWEIDLGTTEGLAKEEKLEIEVSISKLNRDEKLRLAESCIDQLAGSANQEAKRENPASASLGSPQLLQTLESVSADLIEQVIDGSVWRSDDRPALRLRVLSAGKLPELYDVEKAPTIAASVLQLLQQPDVFKNRLIRIGGEVARIESFVAKQQPANDSDPANAAGSARASPDYVFPDYFQIWIRPSVGVDRPLVAIVPELPAALKDVTQNENLASGPKVILVGHFIKRLAYRSSIGADIAPVVVGRFWTASENQSATPVQSNVTSTSKIGLILTASTLLGISIAALVMWRTMVSAQATRELRTKQYERPLEFGDMGASAVPAQTDITERNA